MRQMLGSALFLAVACPLVAADEKSDAAKKLNGTYDLVSFMAGGLKKDGKTDMVTFTFKDGTITIKEAGKDKDETALFAVDASKKPAEIDIVPQKGGTKENIQGIYELKDTDKGTELILAFGDNDTPTRPKDFKGEGKNQAVMKLFRKKEK